jgi:hypothetical protein
MINHVIIRHYRANIILMAIAESPRQSAAHSISNPGSGIRNHPNSMKTKGSALV